MIEQRPFLNILTHMVMIVGLLAVCFPLWMTLVAATHHAEELSLKPLPLWFETKAGIIFRLCFPEAFQKQVGYPFQQ